MSVRQREEVQALLLTVIARSSVPPNKQGQIWTDSFPNPEIQSRAVPEESAVRRAADPISQAVGQLNLSLWRGNPACPKHESTVDSGSFNQQLMSSFALEHSRPGSVAK